jgi:hypothetical protein
MILILSRDLSGMLYLNDGADERYMCRDPKQIKFAPLNRDTEHTAEELMTIFEVSLHDQERADDSTTDIWADTYI